jgi:hypothetical protein
VQRRVPCAALRTAHPTPCRPCSRHFVQQQAHLACGRCCIASAVALARPPPRPARRCRQEIAAYGAAVAALDLRSPHSWYPYARALKRKIVYHGGAAAATGVVAAGSSAAAPRPALACARHRCPLHRRRTPHSPPHTPTHLPAIRAGPTNSGKTYNALQSLAAARRGVYCAPLRLLAMEVYETLNHRGVFCDLVRVRFGCAALGRVARPSCTAWSPKRVPPTGAAMLANTALLCACAAYAPPPLTMLRSRARRCSRCLGRPTCRAPLRWPPSTHTLTWRSLTRSRCVCVCDTFAVGCTHVCVWGGGGGAGGV